MRIEGDLEKAKQLQRGHGGWNDKMKNVRQKSNLCTIDWCAISVLWCTRVYMPNKEKLVSMRQEHIS